MDEETSGASKPAGKRVRSGFGWDAFTIAASRLFMRSSYFISSLIIARVLGPEGRGLVSALLVPTQLAVNLSEMGVRQSIAFHIGHDIFPLERLLPTLLSLIPIASFIAILASLLYFDFVGIGEDDPLLLALTLASIPASLGSTYASGVFLGRQNIAAFRRTSWRPALFRLVLIIVLAWALGWGVYGVLVATLGSALMGSAYALYLLRQEGKLRFGFDREVARKVQARGFDFAAALFVLMVNYKVMILLLTRYGTLTEVGLYTQAIVLAELIWELPSAVSSLLLAKGVNAKDKAAFSQKVMVLGRMSFLAALVAGGGLAIMAPVVFPLLFGSAFAESADICVVLLPGIVAFIVFKVLHMDLATRGKPWVSLIVMLPVLVFNIVLGYWMIREYGVLGAAAASSASYTLAALLYVILYSRMTGFPLREIVRYRRSDFQLLLAKLPFWKVL